MVDVTVVVTVTVGWMAIVLFSIMTSVDVTVVTGSVTVVIEVSVVVTVVHNVD